ncbi:Transcriptional regulator, AraC family [Janthinobacterium sp. CG23_2]|nr:Transcriptional regulator, AraC family [Janthinobacterium sp. CG23_2]CUU32458.1 Transcriptional regulator, AraC family [Janthinobacterium sp. CG23_2]
MPRPASKPTRMSPLIHASASSPDPALDASERGDGPALIALGGDARPDSQFRLGTVEYDWHAHVRGQLFCVESGLIHVRTAHGSWLLPPHRAGWIPPGVAHQVSVSGAMTGWSLLVTPVASRALPATPCVVAVNTLMLALVRRAVGWSGQQPASPQQERLSAVLLDEIADAPHEALHLPMPADRRLLRIAAAIVAAPGAERSLEQWAGVGAISARTMSRLFRSETGISFAQWRQQARLSRALELLAQGEAVARVADTLGYASPSNFIAMFRRAFGDSPSHYFAGRRAP